MQSLFVWHRWCRVVLAVAEHRFVRGGHRDQQEPPLCSLKTLCVALVHDLPDEHRLGLVSRIGSSRDARDLWFLRSCFFRAVSLEHGEQEARRRVARLDRQLPG